MERRVVGRSASSNMRLFRRVGATGRRPLSLLLKADHRTQDPVASTCAQHLTRRDVGHRASADTWAPSTEADPGFGLWPPVLEKVCRSLRRCREERRLYRGTNWGSRRGSSRRCNGHMADDLARARQCYLDRRWQDACDGFLAAPGELGPLDLERLAVSAFLVGRNTESDDAWRLAHRRRVEEGDVEGAVRCAFWLGFRLVNAFDRPGVNAWIARIERLLRGARDDSLGHGRLAYLIGLRAAFGEDLGRLGRRARSVRHERDPQW